VERRAEGRKDRAREATGTNDREGSEVRGRDNYGRHPAERKGQKRWSRGEPGAAKRTLATIQGWIEKHLRLQVNTAKSGTGRAWERKFLGFRLNRELQIGAAPESIERFKAKVREMWRSGQSRTSNQLRDAWKRYVRGWWGYYQLAEDRKPIFRLEQWIRRHIRKCFWLRCGIRPEVGKGRCDVWGSIPD
jgi:hypothetical protein